MVLNDGARVIVIYCCCWNVASGCCSRAKTNEWFVVLCELGHRFMVAVILHCPHW